MKTTNSLLPDPVLHLLEPHPFTQFANHIYQNQDANQALNHFSEKFSFCSEMLLFLLWCALSHYGRIKTSYLHALHDSVFSWHRNIVEPLQNIWKILNHSKNKNQQVRALVHNELKNAKNVSCALCYTTPVNKRYTRRNNSQQIQDACYNLIQNFLFQNIQLDEMDHSQNLKLLIAVFPKQKLEMIERTYKQILHVLKLTAQEKIQLRFETI